MSEYVDFHYMPLEGKITGKQVLKQTEDAINDLGNKVYSLDIDEERIDEAIENSEQAINTANAALAAVTTDRAVWKNTVAEMKATDIDLGVTVATRGKMAFNDGNGAFYGVRSEKGGDVDSDDTVFLNNGNVAERIQSMNIIAKGNNIIFVANVAELIDSDALIGNVYGTAGYYSANDGGAGLYSIRTKTQSDVEDGGSIIFLDNGNVAEIVSDGTVNVKQFGAYGDGDAENPHDDTDFIVAAANYCASNSKTLYSPKARYKTDSLCIISMVNKVELHGNFDFLELRYNHNSGNNNKQYIENVDTLILRDYKGTNFFIGNANDVQIIADNAFIAGSSFARNTFFGGTWGKLSLIGGATGGWINENKFYNIRFYELNIGTNGNAYGHNGNRFYDCVIESSSVINLGKCNINYIRYRGEGSPTVNITDQSINNIIESTFISVIGGARSYIPEANGSNSNFLTNLLVQNLTYRSIMHYDINNAPWSDNHDFTKGLLHTVAWKELGSVLLPLNGDMYIVGNNFPNMRFTIQQYDENMNIVEKSGESGEGRVVLTTLPYNDVDKCWQSSSNRNYIDIALIKPKTATPVKYIRISFSYGSFPASSQVLFTGFDIYCGFVGVQNTFSDRTNKMATSATIPTLTTDVPAGFEVLNIGSDATIWKWVFNGTTWVAVTYPT